jgi:serine phosphatase RsbU (regulator of sigma subunit)/Tfp pilus assembly protein PilF
MSAFSQDIVKIDSLTNEIKKTKNITKKIEYYIEIGALYKYSIPEKAIINYQQALQLALKSNNESLNAKSLKGIGSSYYYSGNFDNALIYFKKSLNIYQKLGDKINIASCFNSLGSVHDDRGDYEIGMKYFIRALKICEKIGDKKGASSAYNNLGIVHDSQGNYDKALEYFFKSLKIETEINDKEGMAYCYNNIAIVYRSIDKPDLSIEFLKNAIEIDSAYHNKQSIADSYNNIGNVYLMLSKFDEAHKYYSKSLDVKREIGNILGIATVLGNLASLHNEIATANENNPQIVKKNSLQAIEYGLEGLKIVIEVKSIAEQNNIASHLITAYKRIGNIEKSLEFAEMYIETKELMFNEDKVDALTEMETKYKSEKKDKEIALRIKDKQLQDKEMQRQKVLIFLSLGFLIVILIFLIFLIRLFVQKRKANVQLALQNEEILQKNEEIITQNEEIQTQRDLVVQQKDIIEEIHKGLTDSINYAQRIQNAVLPTENDLQNILGEHFVFFKPKDVVSGDFYWTTKIENHIIICVADCTGHGVPGGFMSMLGISFLNEIVRKKEVTQANLVLNHLRKSIIDALQQKGIAGEQNDGMDISICVIDTEKNELQFAGANNPIYIVKSEKLKVKSKEKPDELSTFELDELKGDTMPVSIYGRMDDFTNNILKIEKGDCLYMFTDGFADQFGGKLGKKYKYQIFKNLLLDNSQIPMAEQKIKIEKNLKNWMGAYPQIDDITVLGIRISGFKG